MTTPRIYVLHENDEWTSPLAIQLEDLGLPYTLWHLASGHIDLTEAPPRGIFFSRMSASSHTRGHRFAPEFTAAVIGWLEAYGRPVFNGSRALQLEVSKVQQYLALKQQGIRTPRTHAAVGREDLIETARDFHGKPFIIKHNRAGKGLGVQLFRSLQALTEALDHPSFAPSVDGVMLVQEYIESPEPYITRCEFVGGQFLYAVKVDTSAGFELCPADNCVVDDLFCPVSENDDGPAKFDVIKDFQNPIIAEYERFLSHNSIQVAGIEFIRDALGTLYTYDVNTNTNYNAAAESRANQNGMRQVALFLGSRLQLLESEG